MDTIQAGILNVKMRYIKKWISDRQSAASLYFKNLEGCDDIDVPLTHPDCDHTFHLFVIKTKKRDSLASFLKKNGISTGIHYPSALPLLECYKYQNNKKSDFQKPTMIQRASFHCQFIQKLLKARLNLFQTR